MNIYDYEPTPEELAESELAFHSAIENWEEIDGDSLYPAFQSVKEIEAFNKLSANEKFEYTLYFLKKKHSEEMLNLKCKDASSDEITKLEKAHKREIDNLYSKEYSITPTLEEDIKKIQAKQYLSPKELAILYTDMSISSQEVYRGRLKDKLPYEQKKKRGKITYNTSEVKIWMENNNIR